MRRGKNVLLVQGCSYTCIVTSFLSPPYINRMTNNILVGIIAASVAVIAIMVVYLVVQNHNDRETIQQITTALANPNPNSDVEVQQQQQSEPKNTTATGYHYLIQAPEGYTNCMEESMKKNDKFWMHIMQGICELDNPTTAPKTIAEKQAMADKFGLDISVFN